MVRGERWFDAHRSHAYQRLVQAGWSHVHVTTASLVLSCILGVLAGLSIRSTELQPLVFIIGLLLLGTAYFAVERQRPM